MIQNFNLTLRAVKFGKKCGVTRLDVAALYAARTLPAPAILNPRFAPNEVLPTSCVTLRPKTPPLGRFAFGKTCAHVTVPLFRARRKKGTITWAQQNAQRAARQARQRLANNVRQENMPQHVTSCAAGRDLTSCYCIFC